jgi:heparanase
MLTSAQALRRAGEIAPTGFPMTMKVRFFILWCAAAICAGLLSTPDPAHAQAVKLAPKKMPAIGTVDERYQSYNVEMLEVTGGRFWAPYKDQKAATPDTSQATPGGMPASLYRYRSPIDLANPQLRKLAAALGPAYLRVSGTWANSTYFQDSDDPAPATPPTGFNGVLTRQQWRGVIDFAHAVDANLVTSFAISQGVRDPNGVWTPIEAEKLLTYTRTIGGKIAAAEMFNEPTFASMGSAPKGYDAAAYGRDFSAFHAFIKKAHPELTILGPSGVGEGGSFGQLPGLQLLKSEDLVKDEGPELDAFSYHFYGGVSLRCARMMGGSALPTPDAALSDDWLSKTNHDEAFYAALRDRFVPGKPLWLTETGETACGGNPWASDFVDSFRYLNQLGTLAKRGVKVVMHNTLAASDYALLDETSLRPRPNYWSALLWRRLMGSSVLEAGASSTPGLYLYAHCLRGQRGGVVLLVINADKTNARKLTLPTSSLRYSLTANDLLDSKVMLNGVELNLATNGDLPAIAGAPEHAGDVSLGAESITFLAIPEAKNQACR